MRYLHAELAYSSHPASSGAAEDCPHAFWRPFVEHETPLPTFNADHDPIPVTMNHGRWLVKCPWCGSAQYPSVTDHRFFCADCGNRGLGWLKITWPADADSIENEMEVRDPANRNLDFGENAVTIRDETNANLARIVKTPEERALDTWAAAEEQNTVWRKRTAEEYAKQQAKDTRP